jgi:hypothetical protein
MKLTKYKILHLSLQNIVRSIKDKKILQKEFVKNKNEIVKNKNEIVKKLKLFDN